MSVLPLVVDLDQTLVRTDTLAETFVAALFRQPLKCIAALPLLLKGRAAFKARLTQIQQIEAAGLPYRQELIDFLRAERDCGRSLHLVTAADQGLADAVALHVGLFDSIEGSDGKLNLKGRQKAARLRERFPDGFAYAGDCAADLPVWAAAASIILAGASPAVTRQARALGKPIEGAFENPRASLHIWRRALRLHQWAKNLLVFVPLILAHQYRNPSAVLHSLCAFVALSCVASATYLINDLSDLRSDRLHRTKKNRPLASGDLSIAQGLAAVAVLIALGAVIAAFQPPVLAAGLGAYGALTLAYTFRLKREALVDVVTLAGLYGLRVLLGAMVIGVGYSVWLMTFSIFFFFSMSLAKRYAEIVGFVSAGETGVLHGRGYRTSDGPTVLALGVAASMASVLLVVLYLTEEAFPSGLYHHPNRLWIAPIVLMVWTARIWLIAGRGELNEDPVAFAIKDRFSWLLAAPLAVGFLLATAR